MNVCVCVLACNLGLSEHVHFLSLALPAISQSTFFDFFIYHGATSIGFNQPVKKNCSKLNTSEQTEDPLLIKG